MCAAVDGDPVPVPHFGMALEVQQFHHLAARVKEAGIDFILEPHVRFEGVQLPSSDSSSYKALYAEGVCQPLSYQSLHDSMLPTSSYRIVSPDLQ